jgi:RHS repeat-associated protein
LRNFAEFSIGYWQRWSAKNKLTHVGSYNDAWGYLGTTSFFYDADGQRVKKVDPSTSSGSVTTHYVGDVFEKNTSTGEYTHYYYLNGQRVALRKSTDWTRGTGTVTWLHGDHLGSASLATNGSGQVVSNLRYYPYGEVRWQSGTLPTNRKFGGKIEEGALGGIYDFSARYYDPLIGRFLSADSIVQAPGDPQTLNRYSFVRNNPLKYVDPGGHCFIPPVTPVCVVFGLGLLAAGAIYYASTPPPRTDFLTNPLNVAEPIPTNTAGAEPQIDAAPALGYPLGPVQGVGTVESYPTSGESAPLTLSTPLNGSSTAQLSGPVAAILGPRHHDVVRYGKRTPGFEKHHGVLDSWAAANIPGYVSYNPDAPAVVLNKEEHDATRAEFNRFRSAYEGNWKSISYADARALSERLFDAAEVPQKVRAKYYKAWDKYLDSLKKKNDQ